MSGLPALLAPMVLAQVDLAGRTSGVAEFWVFWILAPVAIASALAVILLRNAVHAALMLVVNFFVIAVFYAVLEAQFMAVVQVIVYAGAIMVLFLFVIMLLGVERDLPFTDRLRGQKAAAVLLGVTLFGALAIGVAQPYMTSASACTGASPITEARPDAVRCAGLTAANATENGGNVGGIGALLFTDYVWPFEVTSVLLVIAALGAMVLGRKDEDERDLTDAPRPEGHPATSPTTRTDGLPRQEALERSLGDGRAREVQS